MVRDQDLDHNASGQYGPGPLIILVDFLSQTCPSQAHAYIEKHTAPRAYSKHAPGVVCISNIVLKHIGLRKFFQIFIVQDHMIQYILAKISKTLRNTRQKS